MKALLCTRYICKTALIEDFQSGSWDFGPLKFGWIASNFTLVCQWGLCHVDRWIWGGVFAFIRLAPILSSTYLEIHLSVCCRALTGGFKQSDPPPRSTVLWSPWCYALQLQLFEPLYVLHFAICSDDRLSERMTTDYLHFIYICVHIYIMQIYVLCMVIFLGLAAFILHWTGLCIYCK